MMQPTLRAALLAILTMSCALPTMAATAPARRPLPTVQYPTTKLHTEFVVEVNKRGQVVRVKSAKSCKNLTYNAQTYGNVLQMWIRHPDGSAQVGLYRVYYDYDPNGHKIHRSLALISAGGTWGDKQGAADQMIDIYNKNEADAQKKPDLPGLNTITGATPKPKASP